MRRRVAVTGMAGISPIGNDWNCIRTRLGAYRNAVTRMPEWAEYDGLNTQLAAPAADFTLSERYTTKATRSMIRAPIPAGAMAYRYPRLWMSWLPMTAMSAVAPPGG